MVFLPPLPVLITSNGTIQLIGFHLVEPLLISSVHHLLRFSILRRKLFGQKHSMFVAVEWAGPMYKSILVISIHMPSHLTQLPQRLPSVQKQLQEKKKVQKEQDIK